MYRETLKSLQAQVIDSASKLQNISSLRVIYNGQFFTLAQSFYLRPSLANDYQRLGFQVTNLVKRWVVSGKNHQQK